MKDLEKLAMEKLVGGVSCGWNYMDKIGATRIKYANGCRLYTINNKEFIDFSMGWGSLFLGHNHFLVEQSLQEASKIGFGMQYETEYHIKLAELICNIVPCAEKVRFTNTGTESTMFSIRMARAYTKKNKIIKFEGHFHGVHDYLNFSNDVSDVLGKRTNNRIIENLPGSTGIPKNMTNYLISLGYNDYDAFKHVIENDDDIAGVILEPICSASALMFPENNFLKKLRKDCSERGIVLIFDEVMTGFRDNIGGAQQSVGVEPDIATISKIMGGGFIISAIVGKNKYMDVLDPIGDCVASGTNNGRLLSVIGSYNHLTYLSRNPDIYKAHKKNSDYFVNSINSILKDYSVKGRAEHYGGRTFLFFGAEQLENNYEFYVKNWDKEMHMKCYMEAYEKGLYTFLMPLSLCPEPICLTAAHKKEDIDKTLEIFESIIKNNR